MYGSGRTEKWQILQYNSLSSGRYNGYILLTNLARTFDWYGKGVYKVSIYSLKYCCLVSKEYPCSHQTYAA